MKTIYKDYLFTKKILVAEKAALEEKAATENAAAIAEEDNSAVLCLLYSGLNMVIVKGGELATPDMVEYAFSQIGKKVPEAFYRGFPKSVLSLPDYARYLDQVVHYAQTYGMGRFDDPGHSVFEEIGDRGEFIEEVPVRQFTIVPEDEAVEILRETVGNLLRSSRPLNSFQFGLIENFIPEYGFKIEKIGSKNTAIKLLYALRDMSFTDFLMLSDVIKLVDEINGGVYGSERLNQLNLKNVDRKFITAVIDTLFEKGKCDFRACSEKKAVWCGLLHHIHYKPKCDEAVNFVNLIRGDRNVSVYSGFEKALGQGDVRNAVLTLKEGKGGASVLRNLDYLASRCKNGEELDFVMNACP